MTQVGTSQVDSLIQANLIENLYKTIEYAEMGDFMNIKSPNFNINAPNIRTTAIGSGSSAYGSLQLTGGPSSMMSNVGTGYTNIGATKEEINWINNVFLPQAAQFLAPVDETKRVGTPYGYGGMGVFNPSDSLTFAENTNMYENIGKKLIEDQWNVASRYSGNQMENFLNLWRFGQGPTNEAKWGSDSSYVDKGTKFYNNLIQQYNP